MVRPKRLFVAFKYALFRDFTVARVVRLRSSGIYQFKRLRCSSSLLLLTDFTSLSHIARVVKVNTDGATPPSRHDSFISIFASRSTLRAPTVSRTDIVLVSYERLHVCERHAHRRCINGHPSSGTARACTESRLAFGSGSPARSARRLMIS